jgi:hypothetical protein
LVFFFLFAVVHYFYLGSLAFEGSFPFSIAFLAFLLVWALSCHVALFLAMEATPFLGQLVTFCWNQV